MEERTEKWPAQVGVPKSGFKTRFSVPAGNLRRVGGIAVGPGGTGQEPALHILWLWLGSFTAY